MPTPTIFLVEDNEVDVQAVRRALEQNRIENPVFRARDGVEALQMLRAEPAIPRPLLMLLDLNMPRMSGLELLQELRGDSLLSDIEVWVLTTSKQDEDLVGAYDLHVAGYLVKSELGAGLLKLIGTLDHHWQVGSPRR